MSQLSRRHFLKFAGGAFALGSSMPPSFVAKATAEQLSLGRTIFVSFNYGQGMHLVGQYGSGLRKVICGDSNASDSEFFEKCYEFYKADVEKSGLSHRVPYKIDAQKLFDLKLSESRRRDPFLEEEYRIMEERYNASKKENTKEKKQAERDATKPSRNTAIPLSELSNHPKYSFGRNKISWREMLRQEHDRAEGKQRY